MPYGYLTQNGYMGYVKSLDRFILFATEEDYLYYIREE